MGRYSLVQNVKEIRHNKPKLSEVWYYSCVRWSENVDLNVEGLEDYVMPSAKKAYDFQLQSESSSCEEEQEDI